MVTQQKPTTRLKPKERFNWLVSDVYRKLQVWKYALLAKLSGRKYYCRALHGESEYNLTINSDLTVSCNCQDFDGSGHLGELRTHSFEDVFFGPVARKFRNDLANGILPISTCARCGELQRLAARGVAPPPVRLPHRGILLENTVRCNVDCIGCARANAAGLRMDNRLQMSLEDMEGISQLMNRLGMEQISFLNLGEPFLSPNIAAELRILRRLNPDCRILTSTNGVLLNNDAKREAALAFNHISFSVHGITDGMAAKYMHRGSFTKAYAAMQAMAEYRNSRGLSQPILEWKYLLFNWNDRPQDLARAIELARAAHLDFISFWPTNNPFYGISWRWHLGMMKHIGVACWKGREVDLRPP